MFVPFRRRKTQNCFTRTRTVFYSILSHLYLSFYSSHLFFEQKKMSWVELTEEMRIGMNDDERNTDLVPKLVQFKWHSCVMTWMRRERMSCYERRKRVERERKRIREKKEWLWIYSQRMCFVILEEKSFVGDKNKGRRTRGRKRKKKEGREKK